MAHRQTQLLKTPAISSPESARTVDLHVAFGLHTFTRASEPGDTHHELYGDNRETRTFCPIRYRRSFELPNIVRTLEKRRCEFARGFSGLVNYVTVEFADGARYAAFFELRRLKTVGPNALQLMVQSAYTLDSDRPAPGKGENFPSGSKSANTPPIEGKTDIVALCQSCP